MKKNKAIHSWHAEKAWKTRPLTLAALPLPGRATACPSPCTAADANAQQQGYQKLSLAALKHSTWEAA